MKGKKILVTGANGFTGKYFIERAIEEGYECVGLLQSEPTDGFDCRYVVADLQNLESLESTLSKVDFDYIVHLAAISFVAHGDVKEIYTVNLIGTLNLLTALERTQKSIKKILIASSANIYGSNISLPLDESDKPMPVNDYAISKYSMELAVRSRASSFPKTIVRPFNYTGVGQSNNFLIPKIVDAFKQKQPTLELGNLDVSRDFSDVRDVVEAYIGLLQSTEENEIYNVCSGKPVSLFEIIDECTKLSEVNIDIVVNQNFVRSNEIKVLYGNEGKLRRVLGEYRKHSIRSTLAWMLCSQ